MTGKKRLLTGLQSSGQLHIGNYFGALKPFVESYKNFESFLMVADYHAVTTVRDPQVLRKEIIDSVRAYMAVGIDPKEATIFQQSQVQEHTELAWTLECLVTVPFLMQAHSYKDKVAKGLEATAGLFNYPMLMAADILLYDTDVVPVGQDQRQHIEYAREAAAKFNNAYGDTFTEPEGIISDAIAVIPGTDGKKMSKSYGNTIPLFGTREELAKAVMSIVTDSDADENHILLNHTLENSDQRVFKPVNVYLIHRLLKTQNELEKLYSENQGNYKAIKEALIEDLDAYLAPMRERYNQITETDVVTVLKAGSDHAREIASAKMKDIRTKVGVSLT